MINFCRKAPAGLRVKICGIAAADQGREIATLGADALGFVCASRSPRYVTPACIRAISQQLPPTVARVGVFAGASQEEIRAVVRSAGLTGVQLHGDESPQFCCQLREAIPGIETIKALRVRDRQTLAATAHYEDCVDWLLLDAFDPGQLGGTGRTLDWSLLAGFQPPLPWFLAGGLKPENVGMALSQLSPNGIDLSSGIERSPGDKDLGRAAALFATLANFRPQP